MADVSTIKGSHESAAVEFVTGEDSQEVSYRNLLREGVVWIECAEPDHELAVAAAGTIIEISRLGDDLLRVFLETTPDEFQQAISDGRIAVRLLPFAQLLELRVWVSDSTDLKWMEANRQNLLDRLKLFQKPGVQIAVELFDDLGLFETVTLVA